MGFVVGSLPGGERFPETGAPDDVAVPVVLVPGWSDEIEDLRPLQRRFREAGWPGERIAAVRFDDPVGSNVEHARVIEATVEELLRRTGSERVDVVAHSMGGLAARYYLGFLGGGDVVRRVAFLATPHRGTWAAHLAWGEGADEMEPGSEFLERLNREDPLPRGVRALGIRTSLELRVLPPGSARLPGIEDVEVCCPTHAGLVDDDETFEIIRSFLEGRDGR